MSDATSTSPGWLRRDREDDSGRVTPALVVAWSLAEPARVGEIAWFGDEGVSVVLGRGPSRPDDGGPRATLFRQRPGSNVEQPPIAATGISRRQLLVTRVGDRLRVETTGRAPVRVSGERVARATVALGDTVLVEDQLLLIAVAHPAGVLGGRVIDVGFAIGDADRHGIVGESPRAWLLRDEIAYYARREGHVLVSGPSGSGKELAARALHDESARAGGPFVARNAATLPSGLVDAELFGNAKNFPNPGMRERAGLIGEAEQGTLFLDEIGELPAELQAHLLRVLDAGEYHRLGEDRPRRADVRIIAATNRDEGTLKHDLLARLKLRLRVPGLDERREDIPLLVRSLLRASAAHDVDVARFVDETTGEPRVDPLLLDALLRHGYVGHVRELAGLLAQAMADSRDTFVTLAPSVRARLSTPAPSTAAPPTRDAIEAALARHGGNASRAWQELGLSSRDALNRLIRKHGIARG